MCIVNPNMNAPLTHNLLLYIPVNIDIGSLLKFQLENLHSSRFDYWGQRHKHLGFSSSFHCNQRGIHKRSYLLFLLHIHH